MHEDSHLEEQYEDRYVSDLDYDPDDGDEPEEEDDDPAYVAFMEEQLAVHEGRATALVRCYLCYLEATGTPDFSQRGDLGPLRGVTRTFTGGGSDPTEVLVLSCGHSII